MSRRVRLSGLAALAAGAVIALSLMQVRSMLATDPGVAACQASAKGNVALSFTMAHGVDIYRHVPKLGRSPELEDDSPATVVIYAGSVNIGPVFGRFAAPGESLAPIAQTYSGVICVFHNGIPEVYTDVDTTGVNA